MSLTNLECQVSELVNSDAPHAPQQVVVERLRAVVAERALRASERATSEAMERASAAGFDEGLLALSLPILVYIEHPYSDTKMEANNDSVPSSIYRPGRATSEGRRP